MPAFRYSYSEADLGRLLRRARIRIFAISALPLMAVFGYSGVGFGAHVKSSHWLLVSTGCCEVL